MGKGLKAQQTRTQEGRGVRGPTSQATQKRQVYAVCSDASGIYVKPPEIQFVCLKDVPASSGMVDGVVLGRRKRPILCITPYSLVYTTTQPI